MVKNSSFALSIFILFSYTIAQDYTFDIPDIEESSSLTLSGHLDSRIKGIATNSISPFQIIQTSAEASRDYQIQWLNELYLNGDYRHENISFHMGTYSRLEASSTPSFSIFELYNRFSIGQRFSVDIGKESLSWGKGYAFNPAGFVNPPKDAENPELAREGQLILKTGYIQSFKNRFFNTFTLDLVLIPPKVLFDSKYINPREISLASKIYLLSFDTDIELYQFSNQSSDQRLGMSISRNISPSIEVHGEYAKFKSKEVARFDGASLKQLAKSGNEFLLGLRFITYSLTTTILEYYHSDFGHSSNDILKFAKYIEDVTSIGDQDVIKETSSMAKTFLFSKNIGKDYLYLKFSQPEPLDILYLTTSLQSIINLNDKSLLLSPIINYKPYTNSEFILWTTFFFGSTNSEYGLKVANWSTEIWFRIYF